MTNRLRRNRRMIYMDWRFATAAVWVLLLLSCHSAGKYREQADKTAEKIIEQKQMEALGRTEPFSIESPEDALRRRLLLAQNLPYVEPASLGTKNLKPTEHWPDDDYLGSVESATSEVVSATDAEPLKLTLMDALQIAAHNSREYRDSKENVFRTALRLDLERDIFRNTFSGLAEGMFSTDEGGRDTVKGFESTRVLGLSRTLKSGVGLTAQIGLDMVHLLSPDNESSKASFADASISIPLLRGAGRHIVTEPLTQAERNAVYAIHDFERYKRSFAVRVANSYLSVLQGADAIQNAEENYKGLISSTRRARRLAEAGSKPAVEVDEAFQAELSARDRWVRARESHKRGLDQLKMLLGLPTDAEIELDQEELQRLSAPSVDMSASGQQSDSGEETPSADTAIILEEPTRENAGPFELEESIAIQLAFENRLDLRTVQGRVYDAQRAVVVAADRLKPELTLLGRANVGEGRSLGSADLPDAVDIDFDKGFYSALLSIDLPLERTAEKIAYRQSFIDLEAAVRDLQEIEDQIKLEVRDGLRNLLESRLSLEIETQAVELAERRVRSTELLLQAGRVEMRFVLDARQALLSAQNGMTGAMVNYRIAELELQRDLGVLQVDEKGIWKEFSPSEVNEL
ncbi:MAG: TolC family protein [bacterium]